MFLSSFQILFFACPIQTDKKDTHAFFVEKLINSTVLAVELSLNAFIIPLAKLFHTTVYRQWPTNMVYITFSEIWMLPNSDHFTNEVQITFSVHLPVTISRVVSKQISKIYSQKVPRFDKEASEVLHSQFNTFTLNECIC